MNISIQGITNGARLLLDGATSEPSRKIRIQNGQLCSHNLRIFFWPNGFCLFEDVQEISCINNQMVVYTALRTADGKWLDGSLWRPIEEPDQPEPRVEYSIEEITAPLPM